MPDLKWQNNYQVIEELTDMPYSICWGSFLNDKEFMVFIGMRIYNYKGQYVYSVCRGEDGLWHYLNEGEEPVIYKVWDAQRMIDKGIIKPLEDAVHVRSNNRDSCERCGYTGQQALEDYKNGGQIPCPGWIDND